MNIYQRINAVMQEVDYVRKDKKVDNKYTVVTHDNVVSHIRGKLVKHGIVIYPEQRKSEILVAKDLASDVKMLLYSGDYIIHFCNMDDPKDRISVKVNAHAADNGDKAPGKAVTYATKMALLKVFSLETGDDEESRGADAKTITESQLEAIQPLFDALPKDRQGLFLSLYGLAELADVPQKQHAKIMAQLKKARDEK